MFCYLFQIYLGSTYTYLKELSMGSHHLVQATFKLAVAIVEHILERSAPLRLWYVLTQKLIFVFVTFIK